VTATSELDRKLLAALERIGQAQRVLQWDQATRHGLTPIQLQLLLRLGTEHRRRRRVTALAAELDVRGPTVSDAVAALRRKRLVASVRAPDDGRATELELTERGRKLASELNAWRNRIVSRLQAVAGDDKAVTLATLLDLIGDLQRDGVITVTRMCTTCRFFARDAHFGQPLRHHCRLLDTPIGRTDLRVDCPEHQPALGHAVRA
jgi:DNA-binding MarR family transcriptional regulator